MSTSSSTMLDDYWSALLSVTLAPQKLWQSINAGWSFGNVTINEQNSSAPQTEQAILAHESYGRQIGKLLEAVDLLVGRQPDHAGVEAFRDIAALKARIDALKADAAVGQVKLLRAQLEKLAASPRPEDREALARSLALLRRLLDEVR